MKRINYEHPKFAEIEREVKKRFDSDFHYVQLQNLQKIDENWFENVVYPEITEENIEEFKSNVEIEKDEEGNITNYDEVEESVRERIDEKIYGVIWNTLFEASDNHLAEKLVENADKLYGMGITVIDVRNTDYEDCYNTGVFLGMRGCGYDFYEAHWIPLYVNILEWVKEENFK
jgi:hypothetical protein